jgi:hypothetical protein
MYSTTYVSTLSGNANMALSLIQGTGVDLGVRSNPNTLDCNGQLWRAEKIAMHFIWHRTSLICDDSVNLTSTIVVVQEMRAT